MKQIWYRLFKTPMFWAICIVTIGYVLVLSEDYLNTATGPAFHWDCYIQTYASQSDLLRQKQSLEEHQRWLVEEAGKVADKTEVEEEKALTEKSLTIIDFLMDHGYDYDEIVEGTYYGSGSNDRRAYNGYISENCAYFLLFSSVVLLVLIVTLSRSNGTYINDILRYGRTRLLINEAFCFFIIQILLFLCQFIPAWIIRYQFDQIGDTYLYYYGGECHLFSPEVVQLLEWLEIFTVLLMCWGILFALSELINRSVAYLLAGFIAAYYGGKALTGFSQKTYETWFTIWPTHRVFGISDGWYIAKHIIWLLIGMAVIFLSWLFVRRRNCKLKYE